MKRKESFYPDSFSADCFWRLEQEGLLSGDNLLIKRMEKGEWSENLSKVGPTRGIRAHFQSSTRRGNALQSTIELSVFIEVLS